MVLERLEPEESEERSRVAIPRELSSIACAGTAAGYLESQKAQ